MSPGWVKSRVIKEFFSYVDDLPDRAIWRHGRCLPYGEGVTFWALGQIVKAQAGILESDGAQEAREKLGAAVVALVDEPSEQEWIRTRLAPLIGLDEPQAEGADRTQAFSAWLRFLEAIASRRPLVVAIEDVHWADAALLDFVEHLVDWSTGVPMLIICSARPELFEREPRWGGGKRNSSTVTLPPLSDADTEVLISALLPSGSFSKARDALIQRAGGNPLFAEEFARMLLDRSAQSELGEGEAESALDIQPPDSLNAIIAARLDALPLEQKALLQDASVVGRVFWPGALVAIGGSATDMVLAGLHELTRGEFVRPSRVSSVKDELEYSFSHALIRDVAYGEILRGPRAGKHVAAANWIERLAGERVSEYAEQLAHHYEQALALGRSAGTPDDGALEADTRRYWVMAGDRAMNLDVASAEACFDHALQILPPVDSERARVLASKAEAAFSAGRYQESQRIYEEALADFRERGDRLGAGACLNWLALVMWSQGDTAGSKARLAEAVEALEKERSGSELVDCYATVASQWLVTGHFEEAIKWSERSLELATKLSADQLRPRALSYRGMARCYHGDLGGLEDLREALATTERLGLSRENARVLLILAEVVWASEGPAASLEATDRGAELAERRGLSDMLIGCQTTSLGPLFDLGRWDELLVIADDVIQQGKDAGGGYAAIQALPWKAQVMLWRGQKAQAVSVASDLISLAREIRDPQVLVPASVASALVSLHEGRADEAMGVLRDLDQITDVRIDWYREQCIADIIRTCTAAGDLEMAQLFFDKTQAFTLRHRLSLLTARAAIAEATGDLDEALRAYEEASAGWTEYGHLLETGNTLLGAGRCIVRMDRPDPQDLFRRARGLFEGLGAATMVAEVDAILEG